MGGVTTFIFVGGQAQSSFGLGKSDSWFQPAGAPKRTPGGTGRVGLQRKPKIDGAITPEARVEHANDPVGITSEENRFAGDFGIGSVPAPAKDLR